MRISIRRARGFLGDTRAATVPAFALLVIPTLMLAGAGVDFVGVATSRTRLQTAVDAAALAVAAKGTDSNSQQIATGYVQNQFPGGAKPRIETTISGPLITVKATTEVPMNVLRLTHVMENARISASATATLGVGADKPTEVVIAFDSTGSMNANGKIAAARTAAKSLLDSLTNNGANANVKIGLVPFTNRVRLSAATFKGALWLTDSQDKNESAGTVCKTSYPNAVYGPQVTVAKTCVSDGAPFDCSYKTRPLISLGQSERTCAVQFVTKTWYGCVSSQKTPGDETDAIAPGFEAPALYNDNDCPAEVTRLGASLNTMKKAVDALSPKGETYIAPGLLWAWRALSPNSPFADGAPYDSANKIIVLITDGANTRSYQYPGDAASDVDAANEKLTKVCAAVKAKGIRIFAVAFQVTDATIKDILGKCASSPPYFYDASDNDRLKTAFFTIGQQVAGLRLVK